MRYLVCLSLLLALALGGCGQSTMSLAPGEQSASSPDSTAGVPWRTERSAALAEAKKAEKPLMVKFFTEWCRSCKRMEETTFHDPQVVAAAADFVPLKVDAEKDTEFAQRHAVTGYPTVVFLSPDGKELSRTRGAVPAGPFAAEMERAREKARKG